VPAAQAVPDPLDPSSMPAIDTNPADYPSNIWVTDTMQKVRQDAGSPGAQHWGTFYGTQNEFVDFQVHVQAGTGGIANLSVTASDFINAKTGTRISASSTNIIVYREAYMNVTGYVSSIANTFYGVQGYYPDILIPAVDPYWHQTTNAWPFNVAANQNQSAWIDVLIPQNAPSGYYLGTVTVKSGSAVLTNMPVIIAVWQWPSNGYMPPTTTLKAEMSGFGYDSLCTQMYNGDGTSGLTSLCGNYPDSGGGNDGGVTQTWLDAEMLMKDHRWSSGGGENVFPQSGSFTSYVNTVGPIMNGTCTHGGKVCPVLPASKNSTKQVYYYGSPSQAIFNNFQTNFNSNGWSSTLYNYLCDEPPNGCTWANLVANGNTYHSYNTPAVPELVTANIVAAANNGALNAIDILVAAINDLEPIGGPIQSLSSYAAWLAGPNPSGAQRQFWSYQACGSAGTCGNGYVGISNATWPNVNVDGKPAANRAMEWMTYLHGQTGELYYAADICAQAAPGQQGGNCGYPTHPQDPWKSVYYSGGWGDGNLVYAGGVVPGKLNYMGTGVTIPLVLPSLRLKHMRDGMQDYEYLNALKNAGQAAFVTAQLNSWITNSYTFDTTGTGLLSARQALGTKLHQLALAGGLPPPTISPCDVNGDGMTNVADVQLEVNMALGIGPCTNPSGTCTVASVQRVVNAALGGACVSP
jgi:hypothetical protein